MSKSIKFRNNTYLDSKGISHNRSLLSDILNNLINGGSPVLYHPSQLSQMTSENRSTIIDTNKTHLFYSDWLDYASYDNKFSGVLGIYLKGVGTTSAGGVAIIFFYAGNIGINIRIDNNRWGGWKWL